MGTRCTNPACGAVTTDAGAAFCSRCGAPFVRMAAPTQVNPSLAPNPWQPPPQAPAPRRGVAKVVGVIALTVLAFAGGAVAVTVLQAPSRPARPRAQTPRAPQTPQPSPPPQPASNEASPPASATARPAVLRSFLSNVHYRSPRGVTLSRGDLDATDGRCARVSQALLTLEAPGRDQFISDRDPQRPDIEINVGNGSVGTYDVELSLDHGQPFIPVQRGLSGNQALDLDHLGYHIARFIRVSTRQSGGTVCVDSVVVNGRVTGAP